MVDVPIWFQLHVGERHAPLPPSPTPVPWGV